MDPEGRGPRHAGLGTGLKPREGRMLVARAYNVMDRVVVEISCVHPNDLTGSHLLIREERSGLAPDEDGHLTALADVANLIRWVQQAGEPCRTPYTVS